MTMTRRPGRLVHGNAVKGRQGNKTVRTQREDSEKGETEKVVGVGDPRRKPTVRVIEVPGEERVME